MSIFSYLNTTGKNFKLFCSLQMRDIGLDRPVQHLQIIENANPEKGE